MTHRIGSAIAPVLTGFAQTAKLALPLICLASSTHLVDAQQGTPQFRATSDLVRLDVTVQDRFGRPIHNLTAEQFTVIDGQTLPPITHFLATRADDSLGSASTNRSDVAVNNWSTRRPTVVLLDDASMRFDPGVAQTARRVAHRVIDEMGDGDLGAVLFSYLGKNTGLTTDRAVLHAAVESLIPHPSPLACMSRRGGCDGATMLRLTRMLAGLGTSRKLLFLVGSPRALVGPETLIESDPLMELFRNLQRHNWVVYAIDPEGIRTLAATAESSRPIRTTLVNQDSLRSFTDATGGRTVSSNDSWTAVRALFQENEAVYTLGFRPSRPMDGKFYAVRVEVRIPGAVVRAPRGYFAGDALSLTTTVPSSLEATLSAPLPLERVPLELHALPIAVNPAEPEIVVVGRTIGESDGRSPERPDAFMVSAFRLPDYSVERTFRGRWPSGSDLSDGSTVTEVVSRLKVRPGTYEVRLGVSTASGIGSVFATVDVPDFNEEALSMSGLILEAIPQHGAFSGEESPSLAAVVPTAIRAFLTGSQFRAVVSVHQGRSNPIAAVVDAVVRNERGDVVRRKTLSVGANAFEPRGFVVIATDPESSALPPGKYRLTVTARSGQESAERSADFSVTPH